MNAGAQRLARQAGQLRTNALAAHAIAAVQIEHEHNVARGLGLGLLDLHGLHVDEAILALDRRMADVRHQWQGPGHHQELQVIVGIGSHSSDGESSLARVVETHLLGCKVPFKRRGGVLIVSS